MFYRISIALSLISISFLMAGIALASEPIPFSLKRGIPEIEVIINDSVKASFVIDTGADHVYIDKTFAEKHGLLSGKTRPMRPTRGSLGVSEARLLKVESLRIGDETFSDFSMVAIDLVSQIKDTSKGYPDGVLGNNFLKRISVLYIDYFSHTLRFGLESDSLYLSKHGIPFEILNHFIVIDVKLNDSINSKMILDTGSSYSILSPQFARLLGCSADDQVCKIDMLTLGDKMSAITVSVLIRDISSIIESIQEANICGIIGTQFLKRVGWIIDYDNRLIYYIISKT